jgi:hypothetical protein
VGTIFTCTLNSGVNIVIGAGGLNINGNVNLQGNPCNTNFPDLGPCSAGATGGVLFYDTEPCSPSAVCATQKNVTINASAQSVFGGAMFFPNGNVTFSGNAAASDRCTEIIGYTLTFTGNNATNLNFTGCSASLLPTSQIILLTS